MKILVTGATGFAGRHLCRLLLDFGHDLIGTTILPDEVVRPEQAPGLPSPQSAIGNRQSAIRFCDITDEQAVDSLLRDSRPDAVVHLAAVSFVQDVERAPEPAFTTNVRGTHNLLEATLHHAPDATFVAVSSAEVYGHVAPADLPLRERQPLAPANLYAVTKVAVEALCHACASSLRIVILRPFNHIGPGQSPSFVVSSFARQIAQIEAGRAEPVLRVGNLDARRDFTDVRDVADAYRLAIEHCQPNTPYNVCSGEAVSIQHVLDTLLSMTAAPICVEPDPARLRPSDLPILLGCPDKFLHATGWQRHFKLVQSLADVLDYWREQEGLRPEQRKC